jgi:hypothetical protein
MEHSDHGSELIPQPGRRPELFQGEERILERLQHAQRLGQIEDDSEGHGIIV